jgi:hypothetical protein
VEENSINKKEVDNGIKINIPIISNQEIENTINTKNLYDKIAKQIYHDREMIILQEFIKKLQKENEKLKNIRYDTLYGIETIHLIPESDLIEINTQKYMIEVEPGKFVDLKQVYQENKKLNEYKENYIPKSKLKDIIDRIDYDIKKTKEIISKNTNIYASYRKNDYQIVRLRAMNTKSLDIKNRLQKLLESEEYSI